MSSISTTPLPAPAPSPRRPPISAGILRAIAVFSVIGVAYILSRGSGSQEADGETLAIVFDSSFPSPLIRAATPLADGFELPADASLAVATGIVTAADPSEGHLILLHKIRDESGGQHYFESHYRGGRGLAVSVGDPVARAQKLAEAISRGVSICPLDARTGKKDEFSIEEFLRNRPSLASPEYRIPPFLPYGGGSPPILLQPAIAPENGLNLESP